MRIAGFLLASIFIAVVLASQSCQRCVCPCSQSYCSTASSRTWNSSYAYSLMGYTKLVLSLDGSSCRPCAYSCKSCTSESYTSCTACMSEFHLVSASPSSCQLCTDRCTTCTTTNNITTCSQCSTGSYLDTASGTCRSCASGAYSCDSLQITACLVGYYQVSPIVCLQCLANCQQCSTSICSICDQGYYKNSSGGCQPCNTTLSCQSCVTSTACSGCATGYYLTTTAPKRCNSCQSNCATCSSSTCTQCASGYYLSNNVCSAVSTLVGKCSQYSSASACSSCLLGFYLFGSSCLPCSINCLTCVGSSFGQCSSCQPNYQLYNMMCLPNNFPTRLSYHLYYHLPAYASLFSGGSIAACVQTVYSGNSVNIELDNLAASSITITWKIYLIDSGTLTTNYSIAMNGNRLSTFTVSNTLGSICSGAANELYDIQSFEFTSIMFTNSLTFSANTTLAVAQISLLNVRCKTLCVVCTTTTCSKCSLATLLTQEDTCVFACSNSYYTYAANSSCLPVCPSRTYPVSSSLICVDCSAPCYTCTSNISCLSCVGGFYLYNSSCLAACPTYYYANNISKTCERCVGRCLTCISPTACLSCSVGFLTGHQCVDNCTTFAVGMYSDIPTLMCQMCSGNCQNCSDSPTNCTACPATQPYLINSTCYTNCPLYTYSSAGMCLSCSYPCLTCSSNSSNCTACIYNYLYNYDCISNCPDGFYQQTKNLTCVACQQGCSLCAYRSGFCQQCISPYFFFNSSCLLKCPNGYYGINLKCQKCVSPCFTCTNASFCTSCLSNFLNQTAGACVGQSLCANGYFADINTLQCLPCSAPCLRCSIVSTQCTACSNPLLLQSSVCTSSCNSGYYANQTISKCVACVAPCLTCTNATSCQSCVTGYLYSSITNQCLSYCPAGQYIDMPNSRCLTCGINCLLCKLANSCQQCASTSYLYPLTGTCITNCSATNGSYYSDETTSKCLLCIQPCLTCSSVVDCTSCLSGVLNQNRCVGSCPLGTYSNSNGVCLSCSAACFSCFVTAGNCTSCTNNTYLLFNQCLQQCPINYYPEPVLEVCSQCNPRCLNCTNYTYCLKCQEGYLDSTNNCVDACSYGYFADISNHICSLCDASCSSCANLSTNCISCSSGYLLVQLTITSSACRLKCNSGQYSLNSICYACSSPCLECQSSSYCLSCIQGTILMEVSHTCLSICPLSTFESAGKCVSCDSKCSSCSSASYCLSCYNSSLYVYLGDCYQTCPSQYYGEITTKMCTQCIAPCLTCTSKFNCLSCTSGYLLNGYCYEICPPGSFNNLTSKFCDACHTPCLTCVIHASYCTKCVSNYYIYNGSCQQVCPSNSYVSEGFCETCPYPCLTCLNSVICTSCLGGFLNYLNATCITGPTCPNDMYNMDGKACIRASDCPSNYLKDSQDFSCSTSCNLGKYTFNANNSCLSSCPSGYYAGTGLVCKSFEQLNTTLLGAQLISFVQSSGLFVELLFNETVEWVYPVTNTSYIVTPTYQQKRLLFVVQNGSRLAYATTNESQRIELPSAVTSPWLTVNLPAYYVRSAVTGFPLQTPNITTQPHSFVQYSLDQKITGAALNQLSQSMSVIIVIVSIGFLAINRLSDVYIIWDLSQLVYLLIFLDVQYPANLNEFILGLKGTHLYLLPNMFQMPNVRQDSSSPYYAYSFDVNFLRSAGHNFVLVLVVLGGYLILKLLQLLISKIDKLNSNERLRKIVYKGVLRFRWHYTNDFFYLTFLNVISYAVAQTQDMNTGYYLFPLTITLIALSVICYITFPIFVAIKLYRHFGNIAKGKHIENLKCFYRGIDKTNKFGVALILLRYFRKLLFALVIPLLSAKPLLALPILTMSSVLLGLFIFVHKPFKKRISNVVNVVTEGLLVCLFFIISVIYFLPDTYLTAKWVLGWVAVLLLAGLLFGHMFYIFCKTLFYLQPQRDPALLALSASDKDPLAALRKNRSLMVRMAEEFFNKMFPNLKHNFSLDSSDEEDHTVEQGDSQDSENNDYFKQAMYNLSDVGTSKMIAAQIVSSFNTTPLPMPPASSKSLRHRSTW